MEEIQMEQARKLLARDLNSLTEVKMALVSCRNKKGKKLERELEELPYDTILPIDKRMAKRLRRLPELTFDPDFDIAMRIEREIIEINGKIVAIAEKLNKNKKLVNN